MNFADELEKVLPPDLPNRDQLVAKADQHLRLIVEANSYMNLTRITDPLEAAIKHVYDCVAPWRHFENANRIMDAGTGAGFPGIPLAILFPRTRLCLSESIQKKARFVDSAVETLELANVHVFPDRAEKVAVTQKPDVITARAVAPITRIVDLFDHVLRNGTRLLLYKGPDVEHEIAEARDLRIHAEVIEQYELPHGMGTRTLIQLRRKERRSAQNGAASAG